MLAVRLQEKKQSAALKVAGEEYCIEVRRSQRARRLSLKVSHTERSAILTLPEQGQEKDAQEFLARHMDWLKRQLDRLPQPAPLVDGAIVPLRGAPHRLSFAGMVRNRGVVWIETACCSQEAAVGASAPMFGDPGRRGPAAGAFAGCSSSSPAFRALVEGVALANPQPAAPQTGACPFVSGVCQCPSRETPHGPGLPRLMVAGGAGYEGRRLADWLKAEARRDLSERVAHHARNLECSPKRVNVRDQSTRWGSCSTTGALSFSWRLIFAPAHVLDYVAAHEVAHLREMNHGPRFWRLVRQTMPRMQEARCWLKRWGAELHRFRAEA